MPKNAPSVKILVCYHKPEHVFANEILTPSTWGGRWRPKKTRLHRLGKLKIKYVPGININCC